MREARTRIKKPCNECPFTRSCMRGWLGKKRAIELSGLINDDLAFFPCHKTIDYGSRASTTDQKQTAYCAGFLAFMIMNDNIPVFFRLGILQGWFKLDEFEIDGMDVFDTPADMINHHE